MEFKNWLDVERGRYTALAEHLGVTVSRVSQMADDGVPVKFMQAVSAFTQGSVSVGELVDARTPKAPELIGTEGAPEVPAKAEA